MFLNNYAKEHHSNIRQKHFAGNSTAGISQRHIFTTFAATDNTRQAAAPHTDNSHNVMKPSDNHMSALSGTSAQPAFTMEPVGSYPFVAEPFHCDFNYQLMMGHLGNYMLNAADYHAAARRFGMIELSALNRSWVLSRLAIEMTAMPRAYDKFTIETWVESAMRFFTNRNFAVVGADGTPLGFGRSVWAMIDRTTRQPVNILEMHEGLLGRMVCPEKLCPIDKGTRVRVGQEALMVGELKTGYSDIDVNGHVNSIRYIEHVLDLFGIDFYHAHILRRFEVAYVAEAYAGDTLRFYREEPATDQWAVRITKVNADDTETEVTRCALIFAPMK